jgi:hypothetical protein
MSWTASKILFLAAFVSFAIAVLLGLDVFTLNSKINWTDLGLFFGFLAFFLEK